MFRIVCDPSYDLKHGAVIFNFVSFKLLHNIDFNL